MIKVLVELHIQLTLLGFRLEGFMEELGSALDVEEDYNE